MEFNWSLLVGFDLFISYRRSDSTPYAAALAKLLTAADFRVFLDDKDAAPGQPLTTKLRSALRRSQVLLVVVSPELPLSPWVPQELEIFSQTGRDIIPIYLSPALIETIAADPRYEPLNKRGILWLDQDPPLSPEPSAAVLGGIQKNFKHRRANRNLRLLGLLAGLILTAATAIATWQRFEAVSQKAEADRQRHEAIEQRKDAELQRERAEKQTEIAETQTQLAQASEKEAQRQQAIATDQRDLAVSRELVERTRNLVADDPLKALAVALTNSNHPKTGRLPHVVTSLATTLDQTAEIARFETSGILPRALSWNAKTQRLAILDYGHLELAQLSGRRLIPPITPAPDQKGLHANAVALQPGGLPEVAIAGGDRTSPGYWQLFSTATSQPLTSRITVDDGPLLAIAYSPDGNTIATAGAGGNLRLYSRSGKLTSTIRASTKGAIRALLFSPDGGSIFTATGALPTEVATPFDEVPELAIRQWTLDGKEAAPPLLGHESSILSLAIHGSILASAGADGVARLWNLAATDPAKRFEELPESLLNLPATDPSKRLVATLKGHTGGVSTVAFFPDGKLLTGGNDGTLRVWQSNGSPLQGPFYGHRSRIISAIPTGPREFVSLGQDRTVRRWSPWNATDLPPQDPNGPVALTSTGLLTSTNRGAVLDQSKPLWQAPEAVTFQRLGVSNNQKVTLRLSPGRAGGFRL